jgi:hypothetical protein
MENKIQDLQAQLKVRFIQKNYLFYLVSRSLIITPKLTKQESLLKTTGATKISIWSSQLHFNIKNFTAYQNMLRAGASQFSNRKPESDPASLLIFC